MPLSSASRAYHQRWRFEAERVGLLAIDERGGVRAPIPAGPSPRLLPFLQERLVQCWRDSGRNKLHDVPFEVNRNLSGASRTVVLTRSSAAESGRNCATDSRPPPR